MLKKTKISDIFAYFQGYYRYHIYYSYPILRRMLIRQHILEQIQWRIAVMDQECFENGSCKICGCDTTALQMANKACGKPCYPKMMNKSDWAEFKVRQMYLKQYPITPDKVLKENKGLI